MQAVPIQNKAVLGFSLWIRCSDNKKLFNSNDKSTSSFLFISWPLFVKIHSNDFKETGTWITLSLNIA